MEKTHNKGKKLILAVWICAALLLAAVAAAVALEIRETRKLQAQSQPDFVPETSEQQETEEKQEESQTEKTGWDLPENPYGPEDFFHEGDYLVCHAGESRIGVDVSAWQEEIDWVQVKEAGIDFAMIRLAWRGSTEGGLFEDERARENYVGAKEAGLQVGGYFFSQAITPEEAVEEAEFLLNMIDGWELELPLVYDWEFAGGSRTENMDEETINACTVAFCDTIAAAGYEAMVYFSPVNDYEINLEALKDHKFWMALWMPEMDFDYRVDMWQYTDSGSVPGINTPVDMNILFLYE